MLKSFDNSLSALKGATVDVLPGNGYPEPGQASILMRFSNGALLTAGFWRIVGFVYRSTIRTTETMRSKATTYMGKSGQTTGRMGGSAIGRRMFCAK